MPPHGWAPHFKLCFAIYDDYMHTMQSNMMIRMNQWLYYHRDGADHINGPHFPIVCAFAILLLTLGVYIICNPPFLPRYYKYYISFVSYSLYFGGGTQRCNLVPVLKYYDDWNPILYMPTIFDN